MTSRSRLTGQVLGIVCLALTSTAILAGPSTPRADLAVTFEAPPSVDIGLPTVYRVTVANLGPQASSTITARVVLPLSNTSPQVFPLGTVSGLDPRCSMVNNALSCSLTGLPKGWSTTFSYTYAAPVSTKTLQMTASATPGTADPVSGNNSASRVPNLVYPSRPITSSPITVRHCTGTSLTSFFECARYPSSISGFTATLRADLTIAFQDASYSGTWSQNSARTSLKMEFFDNTGPAPVKVSEFNGWAINGSNCFHGLTTHVSSTTYVSPYEVCMP